MWQLLKADFKYSMKSLIGITVILILFVLASIYFYLPVGDDGLRGFFGGFLSVILFIPQIISHQEKRNRLFRILPVTTEQAAKQRIFTIFSETIVLIFSLVIIGLSTSFTKNITIAKLFGIIGTAFFVLGGFLFLRDKWYSFFEKKKRILIVIKYFILYTFPLAGSLWFVLNYLKQYNILINISRDYLIAVTFFFSRFSDFNADNQFLQKAKFLFGLKAHNVYTN